MFSSDVRKLYFEFKVGPVNDHTLNIYLRIGVRRGGGGGGGGWEPP